MHQDDGFAFTCYLVAHLLVSYLNIMRGNSGLLWHDFLRPSILDYSHKFTISSICICCQVGRLKSCLRGPVEACLACASWPACPRSTHRHTQGMPLRRPGCHKSLIRA